MSEAYDAAKRAADDWRDAVLRAGGSPVAVQEVYDLALRLAGSLLPPVSGTFTASLDAAKITTR